jgi:hypothetical protein
MNLLPPSTPRRSGEAESSEWRVFLREASHYWEPRRVAYNVVLAIVALIWLGWTWPHFRPALTLHSLYLLSVLAILANACYSMVYLADVAAQYSSHRAAWRRGRWGVWLAGTLFAVLLENYWIADEIYPFVR